MKTKFLLILVCILICGNAHAANLSLTPEQGNTLIQIIINVVTFLCGLFINPKKKDS